MGLCFRIIEGTQQGTIMPIAEGYYLGRKGGPAELQLDDKKTSGQHAKIDKGSDGKLYLIDYRSKNGLRVNNQKVTRVAIELGLKVLIGASLLEVIEQQASAGQNPTPPQTIVPRAPDSDSRTWYQILEEFTSLISENTENKPRPLVALSNPVRLYFLAGLQAETKWVIGYGPRRVGAISPDLPILEDAAPEICFELVPTPQGLLFKTAHADIVQINANSQGSVLLKQGDMIQIYETKIEVSFSP